jgi:RND family efflux transporter MFP subunit
MSPAAGPHAPASVIPEELSDVPFGDVGEPEPLPPRAPPPPPRLALRALLPFAIVGGGFALTAALFASSGEAEQGAPEVLKLPVEIIALDSADANAVVTGTGAVLPSQQIVVVPEVPGRVDWVSDQLLPGGRLSQGDAFAQIDRANYGVALAAETTKLQQAQLELELERGRGEVAKREWALLGEKDGQAAAQADAQLALRHPNLKIAELSVQAAEVARDKARLDLRRTTLSAPFNALVVSEAVDVGQVVGAQSQVATLIGTDRFWVQASLPFDRLSVIDVPGVPRPDGSLPEIGAVAEIIQTLPDGKTAVRKGQVISRSGQLDSQTRSATVMIAVERPLDPGPGEQPLYAGAFVDVRITGRPVVGAFRLPRAALRNGDTVWVVDPDEKLQRRTVSLAWSLPEEVMVNGGLQPGDRVVVSALSAPIAGQPVVVQPTAAEEG